MSGRFVGFDPARIATLSTRTVEAVEHLRGIASADPAAQAAMSRVANVRFELETLWIPTIARVAGDQSMVGWASDDPEPPPTPWDQVLATASANGEGQPSDEPPSEDYLTEDHSDLIDVLQPPIPGQTIGIEWNQLAPWEQEWLLVNQPDAVMEYMLRHGNVLTEEQLDELEQANGYAEFTMAFLAKFGIEVGVRWFTVDLGGESELVVQYMSDGTVRAVVAEKGTFGVSVDIGDIEIGAGLYVKAGEVLVFDSPEEAEAAIERLISATNVSLADQFVRIWSGFWSGDWRSDAQKEVDDLWEEYGEEQSTEVGGYISVHGEISGALALAGDASLEAGVYTTTDADGNVTQEGVRVAAAVSGSVTSDGATVTGGASVVVDAHRESATGDEFVTITVVTQGGSGVSTSVANLGGAGLNLSASATQSTVVTTSITVPVNDETVGNTAEVIEGVLAGDLPVDALDALYDDAEITIAVDAVTTESVGASADGGAVGVESSYTVSQGENVVTYHKNPNGEMYSQGDLDAAIDEAREDSGYPVESSGARRAGGGTVSWDAEPAEPAVAGGGGSGSGSGSW